MRTGQSIKWAIINRRRVIIAWERCLLQRLQYQRQQQQQHPRPFQRTSNSNILLDLRCLMSTSQQTKLASNRWPQSLISRAIMATASTPTATTTLPLTTPAIHLPRWSILSDERHFWAIPSHWRIRMPPTRPTMKVSRHTFGLGLCPPCHTTLCSL